MLVHQADRERMAEAFGLYALTGKATSFIAPFLVALATGLSGSQRVGVVPNPGPARHRPRADGLGAPGG